MTNNNELNNINIKINSPPKEERLSPTFKTKKLEGQEKVGKHGKSHHEYMKVMNHHKAVTELRKITLQELAEHNKAESAWLSLGGTVYDVTTYYHYHPGGEIILKGCGK